MRVLLLRKVARFFILLFSIYTLTACGGSSDAPLNNAPTASEVTITDENGPLTVTGDILSGAYIYNDIEGDMEGVSKYRWLRNGIYIDGANALTYILTSEDSGKSVSFEVTPVSNTGATEGKPVQSNMIDIYAGFVDTLQSLGVGDSTAIALGDLDGDFDLDIVVANYDQGNRVYINDGAGYFTDSGQSLGSNDSTAIALGDIDNDGDLDMVVGNGGFGLRVIATGNRIYLNNGLGQFNDTGQTQGTNYSTSVALGDIDSDGDLDMAISKSFNQSDRVYINDGIGFFSDSGQSLGLASSNSIVFGDVDNDGDLDLVEGGGRINQIYINDGVGAYTYFSMTTPEYDIYSAALGDMDGDGDLDIVTAGFADQVFINNGTGVFTAYGESLQSTSIFVAIGDLDGDGDLDTVTAGNYLGGNRVRYNDGTGNLTDSGQSIDGNDSRSVALGDLDGDGDLDMVVGDFLKQGNRVYLYQ